MKVTFKDDYKKKCFQAYQYSPYINKIMEHLELGDSASLRSYLDGSIDDLQIEINQPIGEGEASIHNARVHQLKLMYFCWHELFKILDEQDVTEYELL
jgi:nucleoside-specific outer membrane channel protein Tsx